MIQIIKKISKGLAVVGLLLGLATAFAAPTSYAAVDCSDPKNVADPACSAVSGAKGEACKGLEATGTTNCGNVAGSNFEDILKAIINILTVAVGAICVVMIIIGGFRYVVSAGDSNATAGAKNTILYALVGLVVVIFARTIVGFVLSKV